MSEYISKEEALKIIGFEESWLSDTNHTAYDVDIAFHGLKKKIESATSADVRPNIHGHWGRRIVDNGFNADWVCSECGHREYTDFIHMNFCPNCGADMRGDTAE